MTAAPRLVSVLALVFAAAEADLDERLPRDPESARPLVDLAKQVDGEVDVHALDVTAGAGTLLKSMCADMSFPRVVQDIESRSGGVSVLAVGCSSSSRGWNDDVGRRTQEEARVRGRSQTWEPDQ